MARRTGWKTLLATLVALAALVVVAPSTAHPVAAQRAPELGSAERASQPRAPRQRAPQQQTCELVGDAALEGVTSSTAPGFEVDLLEHARVTIGEGPRARVVGLAPIAFEGAAPLEGVHVAAATGLRWGGVLDVARGAPLRVGVGAAGLTARPRLAGIATAAFDVGCEALTRSATNAESDVSEGERDVRERDVSESESDVSESEGERDASEEVLEVVTPRGRGLVVRPLDRREGRGVRVRVGSGARLALEVVGRRAGALEVRADLGEGFTLRGLVDAEDVVREGIASGCGCEAASACGYGFANSTRRTAFVRAGTTLRVEVEGRSMPFGVLTEDVSSEVIVVRPHGSAAAFRVTDTGLEAHFRRAASVVHVARLGTVAASPCGPTGFLVEEADLVTP